MIYELVFVFFTGASADPQQNVGVHFFKDETKCERRLQTFAAMAQQAGVERYFGACIETKELTYDDDDVEAAPSPSMDEQPAPRHVSPAGTV